MYEELIEKLRTASKASKALAVLLPHSGGNAVADLMDEAADEIAELYSEYKDAFAVIATAWRDNPKDITLSAYMMKHAYFCKSKEQSAEERERELCRSNYAAQLEGLGYNADGTPKEN